MLNDRQKKEEIEVTRKSSHQRKHAEILRGKELPRKYEVICLRLNRTELLPERSLQFDFVTYYPYVK